MDGCLGLLDGCLGLLDGCLGRLDGRLGRLDRCLGRLDGRVCSWLLGNWRRRRSYKSANLMTLDHAKVACVVHGKEASGSVSAKDSIDDRSTSWMLVGGEIIHRALEGSPKHVGVACMFGELGSRHLAIGTAGSKRRFLLRWTRLLDGMLGL